MTIHKILGKLRDSRGETLVETLVAILVAALSVALLFTCIATSNRINKIAQTADGNGSSDSGYYESLTKAEQQNAASPPSAQVTVKKATEPDTSGQTVDVNLYGGKGMYSYKKGGTP